MTNNINLNSKSEDMLRLLSISKGNSYLKINPCVSALVYSVMTGELNAHLAAKKANISYQTANRWLSLFKKSGIDSLSFSARNSKTMVNILISTGNVEDQVKNKEKHVDNVSDSISNENNIDTQLKTINVSTDIEANLKEDIEANDATVRQKHKDNVSIYFVDKDDVEIEHELICGDCLEELKNIPDNYFDLILADPPFGTTNQKWDTVIDYNSLWKELKRVSKKTTPIALFAATPYDKFLAMSNIGMYKYEWIWMKEQGTGQLNAKRQPLRQHENVLMFYEKQPLYKPQFTEGKPYHVKRDIKSEGLNTYSDISAKSETISDGRRYPTSILRFNRELKNRFHPTQKPVLLLEYLIKTFTNEGDRVLDFCMGSGSTGVACKNTHRNFLGIEKEERYFDISLRRIKGQV